MISEIYQNKKAFAHHHGLPYRKVCKLINAGYKPEDLISGFKNELAATRTSVLSPSDVIIIYSELHAKKTTQAALAIRFGVDPSTISDIWRHKHWGWLTSAIKAKLEEKNN